MPSFLITGTDTNIGKTLVGCGIASALTEMGKKIGVLKPVETGCEVLDGNLYPSDAMLLATYANSSDSLDQICPFRYELPLAPHAAAKLEKNHIDPATVKAHFDNHNHGYDLVIVEGAGGLLVPITATYTFADLAMDLSIPILVVVGSRLGALNHALLTFHYLRARSIPILGYVLNHPTPTSNLSIQTNPQSLSELTNVPCLGILPFLGLTGDLEKDHPIIRNAATKYLDMPKFIKGIDSVFKTK
jgi:dethiobiotin synthetase